MYRHFCLVQHHLLCIKCFSTVINLTCGSDWLLGFMRQGIPPNLYYTYMHIEIHIYVYYTYINVENCNFHRTRCPNPCPERHL